MKPILFNTKMNRAILDGRKSVTRRVVKPQPRAIYHDGTILYDEGCPIILVEAQNGRLEQITVPYCPGDILYVRETFRETPAFGVMYRADWDNDACPYMESDDKWCPSIHMPKEAARLFLRVTDAWVERLQDLTGHDVLAEGIDNGKSNPTMGNRWENMQRKAFSELWGSTVKKADLPLYGWDANPWVWVIEFERISKEEAQKGGDEG